MAPSLQLIAYSAKAVVTVLLVCLAGALLVRFRFIKEESLKVLSQTVFGMMLPCLLFAKVAEKVDLAALKRFWTLPFSCLVFVLAGLAIGWTTAKLMKAPKEFFNASIVASCFGNTSFIPIPLISAITLVFPAFEGSEGAAALGISYISLYLMLYSPLLWSVGYLLISGNGLGRMKLTELLNPPLIGMFCGIVVGTVPPLKAVFLDGKGFLSPLYDAAEIVGSGAIPCALIVLGGRLAYGPVENTLNKSLIVAIALVKLVAMPLFAIAYIKGMIGLGLMPKDLLLILVLVIEAAVPQATNIAVICSLQNEKIERNMASLLFWNYLASVPSLTLFIMLTMWIFG